MTGQSGTVRYEMVHVRPGYIIVEHELKSRAMRSYFSAEPVPPVEEYREGDLIWKFSGMAQSFTFDLRDTESGEITSFSELLGLVWYGNCRPDSEIGRIGDLAQDHDVSVYVAIGSGNAAAVPDEKLRKLNRYFNERLRTPRKRILILPDLFGLYRDFSCGQVVADLGLTGMEEESAVAGKGGGR